MCPKKKKKTTILDASKFGLVYESTAIFKYSIRREVDSPCMFYYTPINIHCTKLLSKQIHTNIEGVGSIVCNRNKMFVFNS